MNFFHNFVLVFFSTAEKTQAAICFFFQDTVIKQFLDLQACFRASLFFFDGLLS